MTDFDACVNCHDDIPDDRDAYCSDACKAENESPRTETFPLSPRQREKQLEIEALMERDGEVRIQLE